MLRDDQINIGDLYAWSSGVMQTRAGCNLYLLEGVSVNDTSKLIVWSIDGKIRIEASRDYFVTADEAIGRLEVLRKCKPERDVVMEHYYECELLGLCKFEDSYNTYKRGAKLENNKSINSNEVSVEGIENSMLLHDKKISTDTFSDNDVIILSDYHPSIVHGEILGQRFKIGRTIRMSVKPTMYEVLKEYATVGEIITKEGRYTETLIFIVEPDMCSEVEEIFKDLKPKVIRL